MVWSKSKNSLNFAYESCTGFSTGVLTNSVFSKLLNHARSRQIYTLDFSEYAVKVVASLQQSCNSFPLRDFHL